MFLGPNFFICNTTEINAVRNKLDKLRAKMAKTKNKQRMKIRKRINSEAKVLKSMLDALPKAVKPSFEN